MKKLFLLFALTLNSCVVYDPYVYSVPSVNRIEYYNTSYYRTPFYYRQTPYNPYFYSPYRCR